VRKPSHSPGRGKKFDQIFYDVESITGDDETGRKSTIKKVTVDLYLTKKLCQKPADGPAQTLAAGIWAVCDETGDSEFGTDINAVIAGIRSKLDASFRISWEKWLVVTVNPVRAYGKDGGGGLELTWKEVERGTTVTGDVLMRSYNLRAEWFNRWQIEPWPAQVLGDDGRIVATIPATPENEKALQRFVEQINELRKRLAALVAPGEIERTLAAIAAGPITALIEAKAEAPS